MAPDHLLDPDWRLRGALVTDRVFVNRSSGGTRLMKAGAVVSLDIWEVVGWCLWSYADPECYSRLDHREALDRSVFRMLTPLELLALEA